MLGQGLHNLVGRDKGLHIQVEGLSPAQKHLEEEAAEEEEESEIRSVIESEASVVQSDSATSLISPHRSAEEGILPACPDEAADGAGLQGAPVVLEADGCSGPWTWGAPEKWEEGDLSGRERAGAAVAAAAAAGVAAWRWGTGQRAARWEEQKAEEKTPAERRVEARGGRRSPGRREEGGRA